MTFRLGLTGSIGMGKSTTAAMFADHGIPVWEADAAVHRLYARGGGAVAALAEVCPEAFSKGGIDRSGLKAWIARDPGALAVIEGIVHPLVAADRADFTTQNVSDIALYDIPLLFETHSEVEFAATLLVTVPATLQRARVLSRPGMTPDLLALILSRQMPDAEKRTRATHIVETLTTDQTGAYVTALIAYIRGFHA